MPKISIIIKFRRECVLHPVWKPVHSCTAGIKLFAWQWPSLKIRHWCPSSRYRDSGSNSDLVGFVINRGWKNGDLLFTRNSSGPCVWWVKWKEMNYDIPFFNNLIIAKKKKQKNRNLVTMKIKTCCWPADWTNAVDCTFLFFNKEPDQSDSFHKRKRWACWVYRAVLTSLAAKYIGRTHKHRH